MQFRLGALDGAEVAEGASVEHGDFALIGADVAGAEQVIDRELADDLFAVPHGCRDRFAAANHVLAVIHQHRVRVVHEGAVAILDVRPVFVAGEAAAALVAYVAMLIDAKDAAHEAGVVIVDQPDAQAVKAEHRAPAHHCRTAQFIERVYQ